MPSLTELQESFKRYLIAGDDGIGVQIVGTGGLAGDTRLAVYANAYRARLVETLQGDYAALAALLGEERFTALCHAYIRQFPSSHFSLRWFGQYLARFMRDHPGYHDQGHLSELAQFAWAFVDAFDAADTPPLDQAAVADIPPEDWPSMQLELHPSVRWIPFRWNTLAVWQAARDQAAIPGPQRLAVPEVCLVWREDLTTRYRMLDQDEAVALEAAQAGADFARLCDLLGDWIDEDVQVALRAASLLKTWLAAGMVTRLGWDR